MIDTRHLFRGRDFSTSRIHKAIQSHYHISSGIPRVYFAGDSPHYRGHYFYYGAFFFQREKYERERRWKRVRFGKSARDMRAVITVEKCELLFSCGWCMRMCVCMCVWWPFSLGFLIGKVFELLFIDMNSRMGRNGVVKVLVRFWNIF